MHKVSTLRDITLGGSTYIFLLVGEREQRDDLQRLLNESFDKFSDGAAIQAVRATPPSRRNVLDEVWNKPWSDQIRYRMLNDRDPFLMIFMKDFQDFDPEEDGWRIVWLGDATNPRNSIRQLFNAFTMDVERGGNLFAWLDSVSSPTTGLSVFGTISSPDAPHTTKRDKKPGRPGIMRPEYGVRETIERMVSIGDVPPIEGEKWRAEFVERLQRKNGSLRGLKVKSIRDRLSKEGIFDEIEARTNKRRDA